MTRKSMPLRRLPFGIAVGIALVSPSLASPSAQAMSAPGKAAAAPAASETSVLRLAQQLTAAASQAAHKNGDFSKFDSLQLSLEKLPAKSPQAAYWRNYWAGYVAYERALSHLRAKDSAKAKVQNAKAMANLKAAAPADREVEALLALVLGVDLFFTPADQLMSKLPASATALERAQDGPPALRPLYAAAVADWNTPAAYGGQRNAEGMLRKAIALPQSQLGGLQPTWGRDAAMAQLVLILQAKKQSEEAAKVLKAGLEAYPDSVYLGELKAR